MNVHADTEGWNVHQLRFKGNRHVTPADHGQAERYIDLVLDLARAQGRRVGRLPKPPVADRLTAVESALLRFLFFGDQNVESAARALHVSPSRAYELRRAVGDKLKFLKEAA